MKKKNNKVKPEVEKKEQKVGANNKDTNYYLQQRYYSGEMNTEKISFESDTTNRMFNDNSQESLSKGKDIEALDKLINMNEKVKTIIDDLQKDSDGEYVTKTTRFTVENANIFYAYCMLTMKTDERLKKLMLIEKFDIITSYLNLNDKECGYFQKNLSLKFQEELLNEVYRLKLRTNNKLF